MGIRSAKLLIAFLLIPSLVYGAAIQGKEEGSVVGYCKSIDFVGGSQTLTSSGLDCTLTSTAGDVGGDVGGVGDCSGGACLDGSSDGGTYVRLYDGDSHYMQVGTAGLSANKTFNVGSLTDAKWCKYSSTGTVMDCNVDPVTDTNTTYTASGTLLQLSSTAFSLKEGTLTNGKFCTYSTTSGLVCNSDANNYSLPTATDSVLGGVKVGSGLSITDGVLSATGGGYTNLTSFENQTAWRLFYSDGSGDVKELALGSDGEYLKSNGASVAPSWGTPTGGAHDAVTLAGQDYLSLATQQITANLIKGSNINWDTIENLSDVNINWTDFDVPSDAINWDAFPNNQGYLTAVNWDEIPVIQSAGINWDDVEELAPLTEAMIGDLGTYLTSVNWDAAITGINWAVLDEDDLSGVNWDAYVGGGSGDSITSGNTTLSIVDTGVGYGELKENDIQVTKFHGINIEEVGSLTSSTYLDNVNRIFYSRGYIYAASYATNKTLTVVDVLDPTAPKVVGSVATGDADGIWVAGKYAYIVECISSDRIRIFDISDPSDPTLVSTLTDADTGGIILDSPVEGMVVGSIFYVVVINDDTLIAIDVSNPSSPAVLDYIKDGTNLNEAHGVYADGRFVYVASSSRDSLCVIDAQNPSDLTLRSCIQDETKLNGAGDLEVRGGYAYVTAEDGGYLTIVDVSDPDSLSIAGQITNEYLGGIDGIHLLGKWAIVSSTAADYLSIIDISDPTTPTMVSYLAGVDGDDVFCSGNICYVANEANDTLKIYRVGGIETPAISTGDILADAVRTTQNVDVGHNLYVGGGLSVGNRANFQDQASFVKLKLPNSATLPATCGIGQIYMDTDATSGQRLYACESTDTWVLQGGGGSISGTDTHVMFFDGANTPAGDAGFVYNKATDSATLGGSLTTGGSVGGITLTGATSDPCGTFAEGTIFYNTTSNYMCYCNGTNDVKMSDDTTACF